MRQPAGACTVRTDTRMNERAMATHRTEVSAHSISDGGGRSGPKRFDVEVPKPAGTRCVAHRSQDTEDCAHQMARRFVALAAHDDGCADDCKDAADTTDEGVKYDADHCYEAKYESDNGEAVGLLHNR